MVISGRLYSFIRRLFPAVHHSGEWVLLHFLQGNDHGIDIVAVLSGKLIPIAPDFLQDLIISSLWASKISMGVHISGQEYPAAAHTDRTDGFMIGLLMWRQFQVSSRSMQ